MSMALVGTSYFWNIRWSMPSRLLFAASFFGFIIPGWELDLWAVIFIVIGFFATAQTRRLMIKVIPFFSPHRDSSKVVDRDHGKD